MNDLTKPHDSDELAKLLSVAENGIEAWKEGVSLDHKQKMKRLDIEEKITAHQSNQERVTLYFPVVLYTALLILSVILIFEIEDNHQTGLSILYSLLSAGAGWVAGVGYQKKHD